MLPRQELKYINQARNLENIIHSVAAHLVVILLPPSSRFVRCEFPLVSLTQDLAYALVLRPVRPGTLLVAVRRHFAAPTVA